MGACDELGIGRMCEGAGEAEVESEGSCWRAAAVCMAAGGAMKVLSRAFFALLKSSSRRAACQRAHSRHAHSLAHARMQRTGMHTNRQYTNAPPPSPGEASLRAGGPPTPVCPRALERARLGPPGDRSRERAFARGQAEGGLGLLFRGGDGGGTRRADAAARTGHPFVVRAPELLPPRRTTLLRP